MAGNSIARTTHFALHSVMLNLPDAPPSGVPAGGDPVAGTVAQKLPTGMSSSRPLFGVCDVWMGAMVPKRWAKRAVTRNAIKRQIYNAGALAEPLLQPAAHVVRMRAGFDKAAYPSATSDALKAAVCQELALLFSKATAETQQSAQAAR